MSAAKTIPHHVSLERKDRPKTREPGRFYIDEFARLLNRRPDTIRRWERSGMLPKHLHPRRGSRDWRYWTDNQVYGSRGVIAWMKKYDIRPGNYFTDPSQEENHIRRLRVPKCISEDTLHEIRMYSYIVTRGPDKGKWARDREWIIEKYYPQSTYLSVENFLRAVTRYFAERGWPFPPPSPRTYKKAAKARKEAAKAERRAIRADPELRDIERQADRLIRITNTK